MREPQDYGRLATDLAEMARELLAQNSVQDTLNSITAHAVKLVDGCEAAGIMTVRQGEVMTLAATDAIAELSARFQAEHSEGPCREAIGQRGALVGARLTGP